MNLQQLEVKQKFSCDGCTFAQVVGNIQIGCEAGRIEKYVSMGNAILVANEGKTFYEKDRLCNLFRDEPQSLEDARKQVETTFGIVIYDHDDKVDDSALYSLPHIDYDRTKFRFAVSSMKRERAGSIMNYVNEYRAQHKIYGDALMHVTDKNVDKAVFSKVKHCQYIIRVNHDKPIPKNFLKLIEDSRNNLLEKVIMFESGGAVCIPFPFINDHYLYYPDFESMVEGLRATAIEQNMHKQYA